MPMTLLEELDHRLSDAQESLRLISIGSSPAKIAELFDKARKHIDECAHIRAEMREEAAEAERRRQSHAA